MLEGLDSVFRQTVSLFLLGVATLLFVLARRRFTQIPLLRPAPPEKPKPDCMVVIPARNEAGMIAHAIQSFPHDTVIVVDDASHDGTAAVSRKAGAGVLDTSKLNHRTSGKASACQSAAELLTSRWILFVDADTHYGPRVMEALVQGAESTGAIFLSAALTPAPSGLVEHLLAPYAQALFYTAVDPRLSPAAAFSGQCVLVRREAYEFAGGHGIIRRGFGEDLKLARLAERHRLKIGLVRAGNLGFFRFHTDSISDGMRRDAYRLMEVSATAGFQQWAAALLATLWLPLALWALASGDTWLAVGLGLLPYLWLAPWYRSWRLLFAPLAVYAVLPFLLPSIFTVLAGRRVEWKGRLI